MGLITTQDAIVGAAFHLFAAQGYEQTSVDDIAAHAGVGRTTLFRYFRSKDEIVFPDHGRLLAEFTACLGDAALFGDPLSRVRAAGLLVLRSYVAEGDIARTRYSLTSAVPALRDRELASTSGYQRVLYEHFLRTVDGTAPLQAELLATACMTVHNHALRRWLRGVTSTPERDLVEGVDDVLRRLLPPAGPASGGTSNAGAAGAIVIVPSDRPLAEVLMSVERHLAAQRHVDGRTV